MHLCLFLATFFYVNEPVVNMRESPAHDSRVVSQAVFAEKVNIETPSEDWVYITTPDQYEGWVPLSVLTKREDAYLPSLKVSRLAAHVYGVKGTEWGAIKTLPFNTELAESDSSDARWIKVILPNGQQGFIQKGDVEPLPKLSQKQDLVSFSHKFLGLPYTWGGRTSFGYDCSGFVQMLYNQIGISLKRDSKQQIQDTRFKTVVLGELQPGDLIFFGISEDKIRHVGLYIGDERFIHSTVRENKPWIQISSLKDFEWSGHPSAAYSYRKGRQLKD